MAVPRWLPSAARWLAPSAACACAAAVVVGAMEGAGLAGPLAMVAAAGFLALVALPVLFATSALVRGLWAAWQPHRLGLVEDGGGAPRLAGWLGVVILGGLALAWMMFQGTWLLASWTAFRPVSMAFAEPALALAAMTAVVLGSRPVATGLASITRRLDARWRRGGRRTLLSPVKLAVAAAVKSAIIGYVLWRLVVRPKLGVLDTSVLHVPLAAVAAVALAHVAWAKLPRARRIAGGVLAAVAAVTLGAAVYAWRCEPSLTLAIWGERPLAGLAIDALFDLDAIRAHVSLASFQPSARQGAAHPDIIVITIDTVRADHTPPYGGGAEMPALRDLATKGAVFDWAFSPSNVTRRSIPSMMIGLAPNRVRGRVVGWALRVDPRHVLLAERMRAGGYETAGFMCCEGFWGKEFHTGLQRGLEHLEIEPNGAALARRARTWLDAREQHPDGKPLFLWMHILEPHNWQQASGEPRNDDERRKFYDRSLQLSDAALVELIGAFANRAPDRAPIVIVTADHGEALGDHGQPYHSTDLYDSQIRVPLVIVGPGIKPGHVAETVSLTDLAPTVLELAGFVAPTGPSIDGYSIADLATGRRTPDPLGGTAFAAMIRDRSNPGGVTAVVQGPYKLIDNGTTLELYDTRHDPDERANMIQMRPPILDNLKALLKQRQDAGSRSPFSDSGT